MSHIAVRIVADRLADPDEGINAVINNGDFLIDDGDELPGTVRVYNEIDHDWVRRRKIPEPTEDVIGDVEYPCVVVFLFSLDDPMGVAADYSDGRMTTGSLSVCVHVVMHDEDTKSTHGMYWLRAIRGVLHRLNNPSVEPARSRIGTKLDPATSVRQGNVNAFSETTVFSPGSIVATYPYLETVPLD